MIGIIFALVFGLLPAPALANSHFNFDDVTEVARKLAAEPFRPPQPIPEFLTSLTYDDYRDIRFDTKQSVWRDSGNFQIQLIHPGLYYSHAVKINLLENNLVRPLPFSPSMFTYGRNKFSDKIPVDLGFAGFRLAYPFYRRNEFNHVIVFAGASYFRAVAKGQTFGLSARGLAINTGLPTGEEFPTFKEYWIERPERDARESRLYALLDSPSVAGAYSFIIQPGEKTVVSVRTRLFLRTSVKELGIAPLTSMFLYGEEKPRPSDDWRPEVHDSDGLLIQPRNGEWIWRPLGNPEKLRVSYYELDNPRGFGLLQRDRQFQNYEDLETRHELRPNAWITPVGNWGKGFVKLVEIPSRKETNDNIVSYWIPRAVPAPGQPLEIAYRLSLQSNDPVASVMGRAIAMRIGNGDREDWKRVVVDYEGDKLAALSESTPVQAVIALGQDGQLVQQTVFRNTVTRGWRLSFQIKPVSGKPLEMRAYLRNGKETLTETWSYQLEP